MSFLNCIAENTRSVFLHALTTWCPKYFFVSDCNSNENISYVFMLSR